MIYKVYGFHLKLGFFCLYATEEKLLSLSRRKIYVIGKVLAKLGLAQQKEFIRFLQIYYQKGESLFAVLEKYRTTVSKNKKRLYTTILQQLSKGRSFPDILKTNKILNEDSMLLFNVASLTGDYSKAIEQSSEQLNSLIEAKQKTAKQLAYPVLLSLAVVVVVILFSTAILPQMTSLYQSYNIQIPLIFEVMKPATLLGLTVILGVVAILALWIWRILSPSLKIKFPIMGSLLKIRFQDKYLYVLYTTQKHFIALDKMLDLVLESEKSKTNCYYFSTISNLLKQGKSIEQAINLPIIADKYRVLLRDYENINKESFLKILEALILENRKDYERYFEVLCRLLYGIVLIVISMFVYAFSYILMQPLSNINQII